MNISIDYQKILDQVGEQASNFSLSLVNKFTEQVGIDPTNIQTKVLSMIVLLVFLFFSLKISQKIVKVIIIILIVSLVASIGTSIFV